jgi:hypothetical protein
MQLGFGQMRQVGLAVFAGEEDVVLTGSRRMLTQFCPRKSA